MALWQDGDILISFRDGPGAEPPQNSRIGVWSSDGLIFRGIVNISPPLISTGEALQNLAFTNGYLYGRERVEEDPSLIWRADGVENSAIKFYRTAQIGGGSPPYFGGGAGGIGVDVAGSVYIGDTTGPPSFDNLITKLNQDGSIADLFDYDINSPYILDGGDPNQLQVNRAGTIAYFNSMPQWGSNANDKVIQRYDLVNRGLLPPLDFRAITGKLIPPPSNFRFFQVGSDDNLYILYNATDGNHRVAISDPDGLVIANWLVIDSAESEGLAVNCDASVILVHQNFGSVGLDASFFRGYDRLGNILFTLYYNFSDIGYITGTQPEGVAFANNPYTCPPPPGGIVFFMNVTLIGAN